MKILIALAFSVLALTATSTASIADKYDGQPVTPGRNTGQDPHVVSDGVYYWVQRGTQAGGAIVTIANPEQNFIYYYPSVIQNQKRPAGPHYNGTLAVPDSSSPLIATGATRWVAWIYPTFDDSTASVVFSFSVRHHPVQSSDSLTTFKLFKKPAHPWAVTAVGGTVGSPDTLGSLLERVQAVSYVDSLMRPNEFGPIVMHHTASPRGIGVEFYSSSDYISLFARFLNVATNAAGSGADQGYRWAGKDPLTTWKWDLYGYRE